MTISPITNMNKVLCRLLEKSHGQTILGARVQLSPEEANKLVKNDDAVIVGKKRGEMVEPEAKPEEKKEEAPAEVKPSEEVKEEEKKEEPVAEKE